MKLYRILFALATVLLLTTTVVAADLTDYQKLALQNRPLVERYIVSLKASEADHSLARSGYMPSVDLGYTVNVLNNDSFLEDRENSVAYVALAWNLFRGFKDELSIEQASFLRDAEKFQLKAIKQEIALEVGLRYLDIYSNIASLEVAKDAMATLEKLHVDATNRYNVGLIKKNDLLKFKLDLDNADIDTRRAKAGVDKSLRLLERAIAQPVKLAELSFPEFDGLPDLAVGTDYKEFESRMMTFRSELLAMEEMEAAAKVQTAIEGSAAYPTLDFSTSYSNYDASVINSRDNSDNDEVRGQLTLSYNLFDGNKKRLKMNKSELLARQLGLERREFEEELKAQLRLLFFDYDVSYESVGVAKGSITQAEENLRITLVSYREGVSTESDLLDATANLTRAKYNFVAAKSEAFAKHFRITRAVEDFSVAN